MIFVIAGVVSGGPRKAVEQKCNFWRRLPDILGKGKPDEGVCVLLSLARVIFPVVIERGQSDAPTRHKG